MSIPLNDPKHPRWLLDLHNWEILPYDQVPRDILSKDGYGIVSYTWGYISDFENLATDLPRGLLWDVPTTTEWPLSKAREVMNKIGTRFIWWDWMCVPQGGRGKARDLTPQLMQVQGEEIGKQLHTYRGSSKSIVWLHSTDWKKDSPLKSLLMLEHPQFVDENFGLFRNYIDKAATYLEGAQDEEWWLRSGWTLQEGVLLHNTHLIDVDGNVLVDQKFRNPATGEDLGAKVCDLSNNISAIAFHLAATYFIQDQGHDLDSTRPSSRVLANQLSKTPENTLWLRRKCKSLVASGLVMFSAFSPLFILAGKKSRKYGMLQDSCWALLGAMELENVPVDYIKSIKDIKRIFLMALVQKYQWMMLYLPYLTCDVEEKVDGKMQKRMLSWLDVAEGVLLPAGMFLVEETVDPEMPAEAIPRLTYTMRGKMLLSAPSGYNIRLIRPKPENISWYRHYQQDEYGLRIVSPNDMKFTDNELLREALFMPLSLVESKNGVVGRSCVAVFNYNLMDYGPSFGMCRGIFGGMIDIWGLEGEVKQMPRIHLYASEPKDLDL